MDLVKKSVDKCGVENASYPLCTPIHNERTDHSQERIRISQGTVPFSAIVQMSTVHNTNEIIKNLDPKVE